MPSFYKFFSSKVSISISVMRETFDLIEKCGNGSSSSEAHCGGLEGLGKDGGGTGAVTDYPFIINCHRNRDTSSSRLFKRLLANKMQIENFTQSVKSYCGPTILTYISGRSTFHCRLTCQRSL